MSYQPNRFDEEMKRAALYARVSTEEQAIHGISLEAQKERLIEYAKENGLTVVDMYVDEGISARKRYTRRPEFMRMLADVKARKIDLILFVKLDRWFRNIADYYEVQAILEQYKVNWIATEEDFDTTTANGRLALNIRLAIAQDESDRTSERIKFVFQNNIKEGRVIAGKLTPGYKNENKVVVIDEEKAPMIRDMFEKYIDTHSMKAVARYILSEYGISYDSSSIKRMLTNKWYIGEAYGIKGWCPAIVDERTFNLANSIACSKKSGYNGRTSTGRIYLFTGLIRCESCGRMMTTYTCGSKRSDGSRYTYIYYRCPAHTMRTCNMDKQINQEKLEKLLLDNIRGDVEKISVSIRQKKRPVPKRSSDTSNIMAKIDKLKDLYLNDLLPKELYEKDYKDLMQKLNEAERQKNENVCEPQEQRDFDDLFNNYASLTDEAKKAFWSRLIKSIGFTRDGKYRITYNEY